MPELRKLQVATATTVSAKDIVILGCVGGTIKVFPIQTGQPTRAFATFLPCLHKLYFEKQGGNIISIESNEKHDKICLVCYETAGWFKGGAGTGNGSLPNLTSLPLPLQNVTFETKICSRSGRIALLDQDSGTINIWMCPAGERTDFEHCVEIGFQISPMVCTPSFFLHESMIGYVYEDTLTIMKLNLVEVNPSVDFLSSQSRLQNKNGRLVTNSGKNYINFDENVTTCSSIQNSAKNKHAFLGSLWLRANSSSWKWVENAVTIEACMPLKGPPSNEKGDVELHGIPVQLGPSLPTLVYSFFYNEKYCRLIEKLGILVVKSRYGWLYNVDKKDSNETYKYKDENFLCKSLNLHQTPSVCVKLPFLYVNTFAGVEIWTVPALRSQFGRQIDGEEAKRLNAVLSSPSLITILRTNRAYPSKSCLMLKTHHFFCFAYCAGIAEANARVLNDPDTVIVDNSGDPEAFRREDTNDTSLSDYQLFRFSSIDLIVKSLILSCNANHDERLRNQYNTVLQNIYDHVSTWRAFQYEKGATLSNGTFGSECASDLLEELQVQRAFSRLSRHLAIAMIKQNI